MANEPIENPVIHSRYVVPPPSIPPLTTGLLSSQETRTRAVRPEPVEGRVSVLVRQAHHERKPRT